MSAGADGPAAPGSGHELLLRELAPRVLGAVIRRFGDFAAAEDAVQEALLAAVLEWKSGLPDNPGGWLYHVACRRISDQLASEASRKRREQRAAGAAAEHERASDADAGDGSAADDTLVLLFTCCHPALTPPSEIGRAHV